MPKDHKTSSVLSSGDAYWLLSSLADPAKRNTDLRFKDWILSDEVAYAISRGTKTLRGIEKDHDRGVESIIDGIYLGLVKAQVAFERGIIAQAKDLVILGQSQRKITIRNMSVTYENLGKLMQQFEDNHTRMHNNFGAAVEQGHIRGSRQEDPGWKLLEAFENYGREMGELVDALHGRIQDAALRSDEKARSNGPAKERLNIQREENVISVGFGQKVEPTTLDMLRERSVGVSASRGRDDFDGPSVS